MNYMKALANVQLLIFSIVLIVIVQSCGRSESKTDVEKFDLHGKVKRIIIEYHTFSEKFGEIQIGPRCVLEEYYDRTFRKDGDIQEEFQYNNDGEIAFKYIYKRNETRTECVRNTYDSNGDFYDKRVDEYDSNGEIIKESYFDPTGQISSYKTYKYDNLNQLVEEQSYDEYGMYKEGTMYKYDENRNKTEELFFHSNEAKDKYNYQRTEFKYNSDGKLVEEKNLNSDSETLSVITYSYNSSTQISEREEVNINRSNQLSAENRNFYEKIFAIRGKINKDIFTKYDQKGNWIEQERYKDGKPDFVILRSIEYY